MATQQATDFNPYRFPTLESALAELVRLNTKYDLSWTIMEDEHKDLADYHLFAMIIERVNEYLSEVNDELPY